MDTAAKTNREKEIFERALDLASPEERLGYLKGVCGDDAILLARVQALLRAHAEGEGFLPEQPAAAATVVVVTEKAGDRIGRYKLLQKIGEGGCGVVYMAEQEEPVRRRVALKVIKLGMDTKNVIARFEAERQALAMMDHHNIAKVLDAGATETGRPFFVMELVRGIRITEYCDQNNLPTRERLVLFTQVCNAIQHAHQKGIIHRDIKPSNILVTLHDGVPVPKVIDFGIAKATNQQRLTDLTVFTAFEQFIGTPAYMSPEQAEMSGLDIDTRSDIYALGVLLYELLTGKTPFDAKELAAAGLDEMRRTIREKEPPKPSTRLSTMVAADLTAVAKHRHSEPAKLTSLIRGDLDWIVMKALEKDRTRRYETANGLAMDIKRHLSSEPVVARPPSATYKFEKFVRRHKRAVIFAFALAAGILMSLVSQTINLVRAKRAEAAARVAEQAAVAAEREQARLRKEGETARKQAEVNEKIAQTEASKSQQVAEFLKDMLKGAQAPIAMGRDTTMLREILDKTSERVGRDLKDQPEVEAQLRETMGETYQMLSLIPQAEAMHREALRLRISIFGTNHLAVASSLENLADPLLSGVGARMEEAENVLRQSLAIRRKLLDNDHLSIVRSLYSLGSARMQQDDLAGAESLYHEAIAMAKRLGKEESREMAHALYGLGFILKYRGDLAGAEAKYRQGFAFNKKLLGDFHPNVVGIIADLAKLAQMHGDFATAERLYRQYVQTQNKLYGETNIRAVGARFLLAQFLGCVGRGKEAEPIWKSILGGEFWGQFALNSLGSRLTTPSLIPLVPDGERAPALWRYTFATPGTNWSSRNFDDKDWQSGPALFGNAFYQPRTDWNNGTNIWLRRDFELAEVPSQPLLFRAKYDDEVEIFLNGVEAAHADRWTAGEYWLIPCSAEARKALRPGRNVFAVQCRDRGLDRCVDVGLYLAPDLRSARFQLAELVAKSLQDNSDNLTLLTAHAELSAHGAEWKAAAVDLTKAIETDPANHMFYLMRAPLLLHSGEADNYRDFRRQILSRFGGTTNLIVAERMAKASLLLPLATTDLETAVKLAETALSAGTNHWAWDYFKFTKGLAEYRQCHLDRALQSMQDVLRKEGEDSARDLQACMVLAMTQHLLNKPGASRAVLAKGLQIAETKLPRLDSGDLGENWHDLLIGHILIREAKTLIEGAPPDASKHRFEGVKIGSEKLSD